MKTSIRKGQSTFFGDSSFPHGIARSGHFNKRESEELGLYGKTFEGLHKGNLLPENEDEVQFVSGMLSNEESELYSVKLWKKYLAVVEKNRVHHGFSMSAGRVKASSSELSFDSFT